MAARKHIGIFIMILAVPMLISVCGGGGGTTISPGLSPGSPQSLVPDNTLSPALVAIFNAAPDNLYVNVHTLVNPTGEIRGQLDASGAARFATLAGAQETPPVTTAAFGGAVISIDVLTNRVSGFVVTSGVVGATAAHIHNAARGTPGPIIVPLAGGPDIWVVPDNTLSPALVAIFNAAPDNLYVNVHTLVNPTGEIRGQLDASGAARFATLAGAQETPPVTTAAFGGGIFALDILTNRVSGFAVTSGLVGTTAAHIHNAARGTPGPIIVPLAGGPDIWVVPDNTLSPALVAIFNAAPDNLYVNVHTLVNPTGEIRGQLDASGAARFATLTGAQETPPVTTAAFGGGIFALDIVTNRVSGFAVTSGVVGETAAHIHNAARGVPGPIIVPLLLAP